MRRLFLSFALLTCAACGSAVYGPESTLHSDHRSDRFPQGPDPSLTPGSTCRHADRLRYPERIAYCERNVDSITKNMIIASYDRQLGFGVGQMNRQAFKIDHYIPLCMGGSNAADNLWPQHASVYRTTDPLEPKLCELMSLGLMRQAEAISIIKKAKNDLAAAPVIDRDLAAKLDRR